MRKLVYSMVVVVCINSGPAFAENQERAGSTISYEREVLKPDSDGGIALRTGKIYEMPAGRGVRLSIRYDIAHPLPPLVPYDSAVSQDQRTEHTDE